MSHISRTRVAESHSAAPDRFRCNPHVGLRVGFPVAGAAVMHYPGPVMHRRRHLAKSITTWLCLVAYLFTSTVVAAREMVLCVGPGGHVAIELVGEAPCSGCGVESASVRAVNADLAIVGESDSECPCVDIRIGSVSKGPQTKPSLARPSLEKHPPVWAEFAPAPTLASASGCERLVCEFPPLMPRRSPLRTVVFLV